MGKGIDLSRSFCPEDVNITLNGTTATQSIKIFGIYVGPCMQWILDSIEPGKTCRPYEESMVAYGDILVQKTFKYSYFDVNELN